MTLSQRGQRATAPGARFRRLGWTMAVLSALAAAALAFGFLIFVEKLPAEEVRLARDADGVLPDSLREAVRRFGRRRPPGE